jgi:hypothetical protein
MHNHTLSDRFSAPHAPVHLPNSIWSPRDDACHHGSLTTAPLPRQHAGGYLAVGSVQIRSISTNTIPYLGITFKDTRK